MRTLVLASALLIGTLPLLSPSAEARVQHHHHRTMAVKLANGHVITFRVVRHGGGMMAMVPVSVLDREPHQD